MNYIKATFDLLLQIIYIVGAFIASTSLYKFCNRPVSVVLKPIADWWFAKPEIAKRDKRTYFVSAKRRMGVHGRGLYTRSPLVIMDGIYNVEIEELMRHRMRDEIIFRIGSREELMDAIKGLTNEQFDKALTMDHYRITTIDTHVVNFLDHIVNPQVVFKHWLQTQVNLGKITAIDGYVFKQNHPEAPAKNCEVGDFLTKYFDSFVSAQALEMHEGYRTADQLARYLMSEILKVALGTQDTYHFEEINAMIRDRNDAVNTIIGDNLVVISEAKADEQAESDEVKDTLEDLVVMGLGLAPSFKMPDSDLDKANYLNAVAGPDVVYDEDSLISKVSNERITDEFERAAVNGFATVAEAEPKAITHSSRYPQMLDWVIKESPFDVNRAYAHLDFRYSGIVQSVYIGSLHVDKMYKPGVRATFSNGDVILDNEEDYIRLQAELEVMFVEHENAIRNFTHYINTNFSEYICKHMSQFSKKERELGGVFQSSIKGDEIYLGGLISTTWSPDLFLDIKVKGVGLHRFYMSLEHIDFINSLPDYALDPEAVFDGNDLVIIDNRSFDVVHPKDVDKPEHDFVDIKDMALLNRSSKALTQAT